MTPSPQAAEAASDITKYLHDAWHVVIPPEWIPDFAAIIDRAFSARIEAADKMEPYLGHWPNCASTERHPCDCGFEQAKEAYAAAKVGTNEGPAEDPNQTKLPL